MYFSRQRLSGFAENSEKTKYNQFLLVHTSPTSAGSLDLSETETEIETEVGLPLRSPRFAIHGAQQPCNPHLCGDRHQSYGVNRSKNALYDVLYFVFTVWWSFWQNGNRLQVHLRRIIFSTWNAKYALTMLSAQKFLVYSLFMDAHQCDAMHASSDVRNDRWSTTVHTHFFVFVGTGTDILLPAKLDCTHVCHSSATSDLQWIYFYGLFSRCDDLTRFAVSRKREMFVDSKELIGIRPRPSLRKSRVCPEPSYCYSALPNVDLSKSRNVLLRYKEATCLDNKMPPKIFAQTSIRLAIGTSPWLFHWARLSETWWLLSMKLYMDLLLEMNGLLLVNTPHNLLRNLSRISTTAFLPQCDDSRNPISFYWPNDRSCLSFATCILIS